MCECASWESWQDEQQELLCFSQLQAGDMPTYLRQLILKHRYAYQAHISQSYPDGSLSSSTHWRAGNSREPTGSSGDCQVETVVGNPLIMAQTSFWLPATNRQKTTEH